MEDSGLHDGETVEDYQITLPDFTAPPEDTSGFRELLPGDTPVGTVHPR
jgi:hypothetical protein